MKIKSQNKCLCNKLDHGEHLVGREVKLHFSLHLLLQTVGQYFSNNQVILSNIEHGRCLLASLPRFIVQDAATRLKVAVGLPQEVNSDVRGRVFCHSNGLDIRLIAHQLREVDSSKWRESVGVPYLQRGRDVTRILRLCLDMICMRKKIYCCVKYTSE